MAEVVDHRGGPSFGGGAGLAVDQLDSIASKPETLVLSPGEDSLGFEGTKTQEAIGRPIYLDMQVSVLSCLGGNGTHLYLHRDSYRRDCSPPLRGYAFYLALSAPRTPGHGAQRDVSWPTASNRRE